MEQSNYTKYRGNCKKMCDNAIKNDPTLTFVRGHYFCPIWNCDNQHWWTVRKDGSIYDPSRKQFPSHGHGIYEEFNGNIDCETCKKTMPEEHARWVGNYAVCSDKCALILVGL